MSDVRAYIYTIYVFAVLTVLATPVSSPALEMSSKRDCAICHVMWIDDFRTDKETLIEWKPGNVLMADTQGVVSSEEICYSCHDGYVLDSRHEVWKQKNHKTFVKPPDTMKIPANLPLSNKGEIYCGTCHSAHGPGSAPDGMPSGPTSFIRVRNVDSSLCEMCHKNEAAFKRTNGHPLKTTKLTLPDALFSSGSKKASQRNKVICQTCHKVHGAKGDKILLVDNRTSELCTTCHSQQKSLLGTKHDVLSVSADSKNRNGQPSFESGPCGACHRPHGSAGKRLWVKRLNPGNPASQMCLSCHGQNSGFKATRLGRYSHPLNVDLTSKDSVPNELPVFAADGMSSAAGKIACLSCHDVHRWDPNSPNNKGSRDVEGDSSNSFLRIANSSSSALCLKCHSDKNQLIHSDHNLEATAPGEKNIQESTVDTAGPCSACHIPHNAAGKRLWAKRLSDEKDLVTQWCTVCHNKNGSARKKLIGDNYHPIGVPFERSSVTGLPEGVGVKLPMYDNDGTKKPEGKIGCITCHDPHAWSPSKSKPVFNDTFENREGDATNSFLRKANFPSSELCKICHVKESTVDGTAHDLNVTAPEAKNFLGQTVGMSGQCGVCHLVHNSPNKLKLWARPYGPTSEDAGILDSLCTSCHSKRNNAEKRTPRIATHPRGKLITNIMTYDREKMNYTPLFDTNGKETTVGDISCPSCHNVHQWSPFLQEMGGQKDSEGKVIDKYRFLRNKSYNVVCMDCHGPDGLYRYLYFHAPDKRKKR